MGEGEELHEQNPWVQELPGLRRWRRSPELTGSEYPRGTSTPSFTPSAAALDWPGHPRELTGVGKVMRLGKKGIPFIFDLPPR
jgi:hypothetical protein